MTTTSRNDLLIDDVFTIKNHPLDTDVRRVSLPGLLVALFQHPDLVLAGLRPHQELAALCFLVYLSAACGEAHANEDKYRGRLLELAHGVREAWQLYVADVDKPAFLQSPGIPLKESKAKSKSKKAMLSPVEQGTALWSPSDLDVFFTRDNFGPSKHHDHGTDAESWTWAVISQQGQGIPAASNGTTARGGTGRVGVYVTGSLGFGARYKRFVEIALDHREQLAGIGGFASAGGEVLLWLRKFVTGDEVYRPADLDPFFLDDSAKVRLFVQGRNLFARRFTFTPRLRAVVDPATGKVENKPQKKFLRVVDLPASAKTWDLFTPVQFQKRNFKDATIKNFKPTLYSAAIENRQGALFQSDAKGPFGYDMVVQVLFSGDYDLPLAYTDRTGIKDGGYIVLQGIGVESGRAGTFGCKDRVIDFNADVMSRLNGSDVGAFALQHVRLAKRGQDVLKTALVTMFKGKRPDKKALKAPMVAGYITEYHNRIDAGFFNGLTKRAEGASLEGWASFVLDTMRSIFDKAESLLPTGRAAQAKALAREALNRPLDEPKKEATAA